LHASSPLEVDKKVFVKTQWCAAPNVAMQYKGFSGDVKPF